MAPEINIEGSGQDRLVGDPVVSTAPSGTSLPPPQVLPPQQAIVPQPSFLPGAADSASTWPPAAAPAFGPMPGNFPQPGYPPQPGYGYSSVPPGYAYAPSGWGSPVPPGPTPGLAWGGIGVRAGALVLDSVFFCIFGFILALIMGIPGLKTVNGTIQYQTLANVIDLASWLIVLLYVPACWYFFEGTPGQRLLGLRIARASDGRKLGIGRILLRYLVWAFCLCALCIPAVIAAVIGSEDPQKRAWTDYAGDSVVVRHI